MPGPSGRGGTSRPGSGSCRSRTPAAARTGLAVWHRSSATIKRLNAIPGVGPALATASISKQGDRYLRSLFTAGALAVIRYARIHGTGHRPWLMGLLARRPAKVAAIALADKLARMAWAMMARGERY